VNTGFKNLYHIRQTGRKLILWSQSADRLLTEFLCTLSGPKILQLSIYSEFLQARAPTKEQTLQISNRTDLVTHKLGLFLPCGEKWLWAICVMQTNSNVILPDLYHHKHQASWPNKSNRLFRKGESAQTRKVCSDVMCQSTTFYQQYPQKYIFVFEKYLNPWDIIKIILCYSEE
jgi:hypothetical protein